MADPGPQSGHDEKPKREAEIRAQCAPKAIMRVNFLGKASPFIHKTPTACPFADPKFEEDRGQPGPQLGKVMTGGEQDARNRNARQQIDR